MEIQLDLVSKGILEKPVSQAETEKPSFGKLLNKAQKQQDKGAKIDHKLKEACADFEAVLINFMFKSMKQSLPGDSLLDSGFQRDIYDSLFYQEVATKLARERGLGIGEAL